MKTKFFSTFARPLNYYGKRKQRIYCQISLKYTKLKLSCFFTTELRAFKTLKHVMNFSEEATQALCPGFSWGALEVTILWVTGERLL